MPDEMGLLTYEEFKDAVGASWDLFRMALDKMDIKPLQPYMHDRRIKRYRPEWVPGVRKWIEDFLRSQQPD